VKGINRYSIIRWMVFPEGMGKVEFDARDAAGRHGDVVNASEQFTVGRMPSQRIRTR
jgi:hypothetical protein